MTRSSLNAVGNWLFPSAFLLALVWLIGFSIWFHGFGLPNNEPLNRGMLWTSLPYNILDLIDPPHDKAGESRFSIFYLFQRVPFALIAVGIWAGAWSLGQNVLRLLRIRFHGCDQFFFAGCLGLSGTSLIMLLLGLCGSMSRWPLIGLGLFGVISEFLRWRDRTQDQSPPASSTKCRANGWHRSLLCWVTVSVCSLFTLGELLGAMSPQTDFDVVEYHLGGPKEWFQQGQIRRLPHNVYTSFPFLSEMLILTGMVVYGDWQWGALAGQAVIAGFAPLTATGLVAAGRRFFSPSVGWIAALVYLTSPWTYRISIIAYAEGGLSCYMFAALYAALMFRHQCGNSVDRQIGKPWAFAILAGLLAGSAMACKYTGLVSVVFPIGLFLIATAFFQSPHGRFRCTVLIGLFFIIGVLGAVGAWLVKNAVETGNPVYPLAVRVFGGVDRDLEIDAKWQRAHAAKTYATWSDRLRDLPVKLQDVVANNDWHSPLMFGLAPLSLIVCLRRRTNFAQSSKDDPFQREVLTVIWWYVIWQFFSWWLLTHHIDRFYVPMFSTVALLAGVGACCWDACSATSFTQVRRAVWNLIVTVLVTTSIFYNVNVMLCLGGFNAGRRDLVDARDQVAVAPRLRWINDAYESGQLPPHTKILCVGEALLFHARYPYLYNTVFDHSLFEQLCKVPGSTDGQLRPADEIRAALHKLGITHVDVNWTEILRYREPGNYGYTDFVHPDRFVDLQRMGILGPQCLPIEYTMTPLKEDLRERLKLWAPRLITTFHGQPSYVSAELFQVLDPDRQD